VIHVGL